MLDFIDQLRVGAVDVDDGDPVASTGAEAAHHGVAELDGKLGAVGRADASVRVTAGVLSSFTG